MKELKSVKKIDVKPKRLVQSFMSRLPRLKIDLMASSEIIARKELALCIEKASKERGVEVSVLMQGGKELDEKSAIKVSPNAPKANETTVSDVLISSMLVS